MTKTSIVNTNYETRQHNHIESVWCQKHTPSEEVCKLQPFHNPNTITLSLSLELKVTLILTYNLESAQFPGTRLMQPSNGKQISFFNVVEGVRHPRIGQA